MNSKYPPKVDKPTVRLNEAKKGVELRFPGKPSEAVVQLMTDSGFRFTPFGTANRWEDPVWYRKQSPESIKFANDLVTVLNEQSTQPQPKEVAPKVTFGSRLAFA